MSSKPLQDSSPLYKLYYYFYIPIIGISTIYGVYAFYSSSRPLLNNLAAGLMFASLCLGFGLAMVRDVDSVDPPLWFLRITSIVPKFLCVFLLALAAVVNSTIIIPFLYIGGLPIGLLNSLVLSFTISAILKYKIDENNKIEKMQLFSSKIFIYAMIALAIVLVFWPHITWLIENMRSF